jgi:hypothetical protein
MDMINKGQASGIQKLRKEIFAALIREEAPGPLTLSLIKLIAEQNPKNPSIFGCRFC